MNNLNFARILQHCLLTGLLFAFANLSYSQSPTASIQLFDENESPVIGATYQYANQKGTSNEWGFLSLEYQKGDTLFLSHLTLGSWFLTDEKVQMAFQEGKIRRHTQIFDFQPLTVIALRPKTTETEVMAMDNQSRLAHDAGAILNRIPVISSIRKSGGYGFDPVMRGFKYDQLNIVINGVQSATSACPNRMDPPTSQIAPNMMERIEILKGPHALRYGSSFGGTINFVPVSPTFSDQTKSFGRVSGNYESNGNILRSEGMAGVRGKSYDFGVFGSWSQGDDYQDGDGRVVQSDFARGSVGANLGLQLTDQQLLKLSATRNFATDADFPALAMDLRKDDTWPFNASHEIDFSGKRLKSWNTSVYATTVDHLMDNLLKPLDPRMMNASTRAQTQTYGGRTEGFLKLSDDAFYFGADLRVEAADGERERTFLLGPNAGKTFYDNVWQNSQISHTGVFGEYHLQQSSLRYVFSLRLEVNDARIKDPSEEFLRIYPENQTTQVNPSISLGGINNFHNNFSLGLWFGRAVRSGSLAERFINYLPIGLDPYEMLGNPNIDPEVNNQADLSFTYKTKKTEVDLGLFVSFLQDYISSQIDTSLAPRLSTSPGVRRFVNLDEALMTGFDITWNQDLGLGLQHQLSITYTYGQNLVTDQPLPEIAPLDMRYVLSGAYFKKKFHPEISVRHVLQQDRYDTTLGETQTPAFTLVDVTARYQFFKNWSLASGVQNLFDETYYEHLNRSVRGTTGAIYAPGRNIFVSLVVDLR